MDKLLHDSLTVHLENFGYENIPKLENYNETISSMLGVPKFILDMSDEMYENWRESQCGVFTKPFTKPETKEKNKMITAEEAKDIADASNTDIELFLELINNKIKVDAYRGKYSHKEYYAKNSDFSKVVDTIKEKLEEKDFKVIIRGTRKATDGAMADIYNYCMVIIWKR